MIGFAKHKRTRMGISFLECAKDRRKMSCVTAVARYLVT